jgi:hypothetical protein
VSVSSIATRGHWYVKNKLNYSAPCAVIVGLTDSCTKQILNLTAEIQVKMLCLFGKQPNLILTLSGVGELCLNFILRRLGCTFFEANYFILM